MIKWTGGCSGDEVGEAWAPLPLACPRAFWCHCHLSLFCSYSISYTTSISVLFVVIVIVILIVISSSVVAMFSIHCIPVLNGMGAGDGLLSYHVPEGQGNGIFLNT